MTGAELHPRIRRRSRFRRHLRRILLIGLVLACLLSLSGGWLVLRGWQTRGNLISAAELARNLSAQVLAGDTSQARRTLAALQQQTAEARSATKDPAWWAAGHLPYGGVNLAAVREMAAAVDDLARRALPQLLTMDPAALMPSGGHLDLAVLKAMAPALNTADSNVQEARRRLAALPADELQPVVRDAVDELGQELGKLSDLTSSARIAATLLPPLLGAGGTRDYLLVTQNLAELRATGGIWGAYALIRAERGRVQIVKQGSTGPDLSSFAQPVLRMSKEMQALYTDLPAIYPPDVNLTPHFPTAAALYREMYRRRTGITVDGVLAADPVVLSYLLQAIGPVSVPRQTTLASGTAVRTLLSDSYRKMDIQAQDSYFAASALAVFNAILQRPVQPRALLTALNRAIQERRILFWSADPKEQQYIAGTRLAGVLPDREDVPTVGVFLNDGSGAKLGYYLRQAAELVVGRCRPDSRRELQVKVTLSSTAPKSGLSSSVLGLGLSGHPYTARTLVYLFSPARGAVMSARLNGAEVAMGSGFERGRQVGVVSVDLPPGRTSVLEATLLTPANASGDADLWLTPGVAPWTTRITTAPRCEQ